jgi:hypothetical protein
MNAKHETFILLLGKEMSIFLLGKGTTYHRLVKKQTVTLENETHIFLLCKEMPYFCLAKAQHITDW